MRRVLTAAVVTLAAALVASPALAKDTQGDPFAYDGGEQNCTENAEVNGFGILNVDTGFGGGPTGGSGHISVQSCDNTVPPDGNLTMAGDFGFGRANCGYIVYDGDPTNGPADGYVALDNQGPEVGQGDTEYNDSWCHTQ